MIFVEQFLLFHPINQLFYLDQLNGIQILLQENNRYLLHLFVKLISLLFYYVIFYNILTSFIILFILKKVFNNYGI